MSAEISRAPIAQPNGAARRRFDRAELPDANAVLDYAAGLMAAVEQEIGDLWRDTIDCGDSRLSDRLVDLSDAVRRAALAFEIESTSGAAPSSAADHRHLAGGSPAR
jgi:hypothetical protein